MILAVAFDPKRNSIGAIRLVCASTVVVGHAVSFGGYGAPFDMAATKGQVSFARAAVDIFFILSGFLLASSWERSTLFEYARNRFLRIYPGLWLCLLITAIIVPIGVGVQPAFAYAFHNAMLIFGVQHVVPGMFEGNIDKSMNGALWTLPGEVYCYISLPLLAAVGLLNRIAIPFILGALWVGFTIKIASSENTAAITSLWRLFTFFYVGVLFHVYRRSIPMSALLAALAAVVLAAATIAGTYIFRHPGGLFYVFAPLTLGYLTIYAATILPFTELNSKTDLSYGVYIYGTFIVQLLVSFGFRSGQWDYSVLATSSLAIALALAWMSWHLVESPALSLKARSRFSRKSGSETHVGLAP